jgi:hypothetical protein
VSGTIWNDADANGTLDETGAGLEGVTVALYDDAGNLVATTTTDVNGDYSFTGLPDGTYTVDVTDENNVLDGAWHSDGPNDGADNNSQTDPYTVEVIGGETDATADFGYYSEPASLGNYVWNDLDSDGIQDGTELGIDGVIVYLTITYPNGDVTTLQTVTGDDPSTPETEIGWYSFDNLLLDESYDGVGTAGQEEPTYTISVDQTSSILGTGGFVSSPQNVGTDDSIDSDNPVAQPATVTQGELDDTYDFGFYAKPTGVELFGFSAQRQGDAVLVTWETLSEVKILGFYLYRSESFDGPRTQLNEDLVVSLVPPGSPTGAVYEFLDETAEPDRDYYYWLYSLDNEGQSTPYQEPAFVGGTAGGDYRIFLPLLQVDR